MAGREFGGRGTGGIIVLDRFRGVTVFMFGPSLLALTGSDDDIATATDTLSLRDVRNESFVVVGFGMRGWMCIIISVGDDVVVF